MAASPHLNLPTGVWHLSDYAVPTLAGITPVVTAATHAPSGAQFRLVTAPDGAILGLSPEDPAAEKLVLSAWADPTKWARAQHWWIDPHPERRHSA